MNIITNSSNLPYQTRYASDKKNQHSLHEDTHYLGLEAKQIVQQVAFEQHRPQEGNSLEQYQDMYKEYVEQYNFTLEQDQASTELYLVQTEFNLRIKLDHATDTVSLINTTA